jgi:hypothetical protein
MLKMVVVAIAALAGVAAAIVVAKIGPSNIVGMIRYDQRTEGTLRVGDRAPDVSLLSPDGKTTTQLLELLGGRPVVLVFGSFT